MFVCIDTLKKWFDDKEEGWIDLTLTRVHMVGPAGSGKTCAQNLLLNEPSPQHFKSNPRITSSDSVNPHTSSDTSSSNPPIREHPSSSDSHASIDPTTDVHYNTTTSSPNSSSSKSITDSTPLACKAVKALRISSGDNETWNRITRRELLERLASRLKRATAKFSEQKQAPSIESGSETSVSTKEVTPKVSEKPHDYRAVVKEITDRIPTAKAQLSEKWAYIIDSGGQPAFQELLPLFTRAATLNVVTLDLSKGLDEKFKCMYRINGKEFECDEKMEYSNHKVFNSVVSAASVQKPLNIPYQTKPSQEDTPSHSMSFVLGTHYDVVIKNSSDQNEAEAKVKQMSNDLMSQQDSYSKKYVIQRIHGNSVIFPVDTLIKDRNERKKVSQVMLKKITGCTKANLTVRLPIRLFVFELCLAERAENNGGYVTRKEADDEGKALHMTSKDVEVALAYLHECTIVLYYSDIEPQLVFVDPQKILKVLSQLLALTYMYVDMDAAQSFVPGITQEEMTTLKIRGCFKEHLLAKFTVFTGEFQPKYFINLLKEYHIIAEIQKKSSQTRDVKYFLPSALRSYDNSFEKSPPDRKPLRFVWRKEDEDDEEKVFVNVPQGIFPLMIVHLLKQEECIVRLSIPDDGSDSNDTSNSSKPNDVSQFRDAASLLISFDKSITDPHERLYIINREKHIEVIFTGKKEHCPKINRLVRKVINDSADDINILVEDLNVAFACQIDESKYCIVQKEEAVCRSIPTHTCPLDDSYWCWFNTSGMLCSVLLTILFYFKGPERQHKSDSGISGPQCKHRHDVEEIDGKYSCLICVLMYICA